MRCSVANLIPMKPEVNPAWAVRISEQPSVRGEPPNPIVVEEYHSPDIGIMNELDGANGELAGDAGDDYDTGRDISDPRGVHKLPKRPRADWDKEFWPSDDGG